MELSEVQKEADSAGRKAIIFGLGSLVLAAVFGWMLSRLSGGGPEVQAVVVAGEEIPALTIIKKKQLKLIMWPKESLPQGSYTSIDEVVKTPQVNVNSLLVGEPLLTSRMSTPDRGLGISQMVEPNMRAFVVQVNDFMATAELLHPGAFVDVIATFEDSMTREKISKVLLQNVQVLAIGDSIDVQTAPKSPDASGTEQANTRERHRVVTLLVGLDDVEEITYASRMGKIDLALRSNMDDEVVATEGVSLDKILGKTDKSRGVSQAEPAPHVSKPVSHPQHNRAPAPLEPRIYRTPSINGHR